MTLSINSLYLSVAVLALAAGCGGDDSGGGGSSGGTAGTSAAATGGTNADDGADDGTPTTGASNSAGSDQADTVGDSGGTMDGADSGSESSSGEPVELDDFSFFLTSYEAMAELSGSPDGFGGNLSYDGETGIAGADRICETIAEMSMPGSAAKGWRAFLSTSTEDAIDRVGPGPWYDRNGRLLAMDINGLLTDRPNGDKALANDLSNEWGIPNSNPDGTMDLDNHDTMTGSGPDGRLLLMGGGGGPGGGGNFSTCMDWTSAEPGQSPPAIGHSWPANSGTNWLFVGAHATGCEPYVELAQNGPCPPGAFGVGCGGGYGGFYCLALEP